MNDHQRALWSGHGAVPEALATGIPRPSELDWLATHLTAYLRSFDPFNGAEAYLLALEPDRLTGTFAVCAPGRETRVWTGSRFGLAARLPVMPADDTFLVFDGTFEPAAIDLAAGRGRHPVAGRSWPADDLGGSVGDLATLTANLRLARQGLAASSRGAGESAAHARVLELVDVAVVAFDVPGDLAARADRSALESDLLELIEVVVALLRVVRSHSGRRAASGGRRHGG